jgi:hypothetical protein
VSASSAPWIAGVPAPAVRHVVRCANAGAASFPKEERFYMHRTAQEVNQIGLSIDPFVKKSSSFSGTIALLF